LTHVSYISWSNGTGQSQLFRCLSVGGKIALVSHRSNLFEDLPLIRPTIISFQPGLWQVVRSMFQTFLHNNREECDEEQEEERAYEQVRAALGGNLSLVMAGGAIVTEDLLFFLHNCFGKDRVVTSYGASEVGGIARDGVFLPEIEYHLLDVPELGYFQSDQCVELCVHSKELTPGYIDSSQEQEEANFIILNGKRYYRTGDIVKIQVSSRAIFGEASTVQILGRRKHYFKLPNGKWIAPEEIESQIEMACAEWLRSIFVFGNGISSNLVAIVRLNANSSSSSISPSSIVQLLNTTIGHMESIAEHLPKYVWIEYDDSPQINHIWITNTIKKRRHALQQHYQSQLDTLLLHQPPDAEYENINQNEQITLFELLSRKLNLNMKEFETWSTHSFVQLGGNSLLAMEISQLFKKTGTIHREISAVQILQAPSCHAILDANSVHHHHIDLMHQDYHQPFLPIIDDLSQQERKSTLSCILITGGAGFLAQFLIDELMQQFPKANIIGLVHKQTACDRRRITYVKGDISKPQFGLDMDLYQDLTQRVDLVIHAASQVHFLYPYGDLRQVNVEGTMEVLRFCTNGSFLKSLIYISTNSVPTSKLNHRWDQLSGYVQTKLVSEHLIQRMWRHINENNSNKNENNIWHIVRPSAIVGHSTPNDSHQTRRPPKNDFVDTLWRTLLQHRILPPNQIGNNWDLIPGDVLSHAIIQNCLLNFTKEDDASDIDISVPIHTLCNSKQYGLVQLLEASFRAIPSNMQIQTLNEEQWFAFLSDENTCPSNLVPFRNILLNRVLQRNESKCTNHLFSSSSSNHFCPLEPEWIQAHFGQD
jgi:fatty acid CoA ligase FadD9